MFGIMDCGGAETRTMEIYRRIDRSRLQFDFLTMSQGPGVYYDLKRPLSRRNKATKTV